MTHTDPYDGTECRSRAQYIHLNAALCPLCAKGIYQCATCTEYVEPDGTAHRCGTGKGEG